MIYGTMVDEKVEPHKHLMVMEYCETDLDKFIKDPKQ